VENLSAFGITGIEIMLGTIHGRKNSGDRKLAGCLFIAALILALMGRAEAQTLEVQLSSSSITFSDTNPLSPSDLEAIENPLAAYVSYQGTGIVHIFLLANSNITTADGKTTIPASDVYWKATGGGYESGTLSLTHQVEAACGPLSRDKNAGWHFYLKHGIHPSGAFHLSITIIATIQ
jgi:hypothetical protein